MDNGTETAPLHQTIAAALSELGLPEQPCRSTSFLIQDGYCTGQRFLFDGVQAIWLFAENAVHIYDENGRVLSKEKRREAHYMREYRRFNPGADKEELAGVRRSMGKLSERRLEISALGPLTLTILPTGATLSGRYIM